MANDNDASDASTGQLHDTTQGGLPDAIAQHLPEKYQDQDLRLAEDHMNATVQNAHTETVTLVDEVEGEVYVLELKDISWNQVNGALTEALIPSASGDGKLDFGAYYREVAKAKIESVQPEVPSGQLTTWLTGLNERLGKQLQQHLPDPVDTIEEQEAKN